MEIETERERECAITHRAGHDDDAAMLLYVERTWVKPFERAPTRDDLLHGLALEIGGIS
jgi:hypothetical protein